MKKSIKKQISNTSFRNPLKFVMNGMSKSVGVEFLLTLQGVGYTGCLEMKKNGWGSGSKRCYGIIYNGGWYIYDTDKSKSASNVYQLSDIRIECCRENNKYGLILSNQNDNKKSVFYVGSEQEMSRWIDALTDEKKKFSNLESESNGSNFDEEEELPEYVEIPEKEPPGMKKPSNGFTHANSPLPQLPSHIQNRGKSKSFMHSALEKNPKPSKAALTPPMPIKPKPSVPQPSLKPKPISKPSPPPRPPTEKKSPFPPKKNSTSDRPMGIKKGYEVLEEQMKEKISQQPQIQDDPYVASTDLKRESIVDSTTYEVFSDGLDIVQRRRPVDMRILPDTVYQYSMNRQDAVNALKDCGTPGVYLIRGKLEEKYVLSAFLLNNVKHYIIYIEENEIYLKSEDKHFCWIGDLIRHYKGHNLPTCHARIETPYTY